MKNDLYKILEDPRKQVIAVDLDGCLTLQTCWTEEEMANATPNQPFVDKVAELHKHGLIIVHTARRDEFYQITKDWLDRKGIKYHAIVTGKLPASLYIDDRALNVEDL
jgi:uncharacterized HAD superfamily protein